MEESGGCFGCVGVFWLHEDERHGGFGPVCFDEEGKGAVTPAQEWVGEELGFEAVEEGVEGGCPSVGGNRLAMKLLGEETEWADAGFEVRNEASAEVE